jgi:hypothetical protein
VTTVADWPVPVVLYIHDGGRVIATLNSKVELYDLLSPRHETPGAAVHLTFVAKLP